jgi:hypothetical protein
MPRIGTAYVEIKGDFKPLRRELQTFRSQKDVDVEVGAQVDQGSFQRAKRQTSSLGGEETVDVKTKVDQGLLRRAVTSFDHLGREMGETNRTATFLRNTIDLIKWPAIITGAGFAAQGLAALAGAAAALTGALAPTIGLLTQYGTALGVLGQSIAAFKLATFGVGDALSAYTAQQESAGQAATQSASAIRAAHEQVRSAEQGLALAQRSVTLAQEELTRAREEATRQLEDMKEAAEDSRLTEERAALSLRQARAALRKALADPATSRLELADLRLGVKEARDALEDARREGQRAREDARRAKQLGVGGSQQVVSARQSLADANRGLADAERQLAEAQRGVAEAMQQSGSAADAFQEKMNQLSPAAQSFVRALISMKPKLDQLRASAAQNLFPGVERGMRAALENFGPFKRVLDGTASVLGGLAERAGKFFGSKAFGRDFQKIGRTNNQVLDRMGRVGINLAAALTDIMVAARPLTRFISRMTLGWSENVREQTRAARKSGELASFFRDTRQVVSRLASILGNFGGALVDIINLGKPLGDEILKRLDAGARSFRDFTESAEGRERISDFFEKIQRPLFAFGRLLGKITVAFLKLAETPGLTKLIAKVGDLIPPFVKLVKVTTKEFGPPLIDLLVQVLRLIGNMAGSAGPLVVFTKFLGGALNVLNDLIEASPALRFTIVTLGSLFSVLSSIGLISGISQFFGFSKGLSTVTGGRITSATDAIKKLWDVTSGLRDAATSAASSAGEWISTMTGKIRSGAGRVRAAMRAAFLRAQMIAALAVDLASQWISSFVGKLRAGATRVRRVIGRVMLRGGAMISAVAGAAAAIGEEFVRGIAKVLRKPSTGRLLFRSLLVGIVLAGVLLAPHVFDIGKKLGEKWGKGMVRTLARVMRDGINKFIIGPANYIIDRLNEISPFGDIGKIGKIGGEDDRIRGTGRTAQGEGPLSFRAAARRIRRGGGFRPGHHGGIATRDGLRQLVGVSGYQGGGIVGQRGPRPGARDKIPALLEVGELVIPRKMVELAKEGSKKVAIALKDQISRGYQRVAKDGKKFGSDNKKLWGELRGNATKLSQRYREGTTKDFERATRDSLKQTDRIRKGTGDDFGKLRRSATGASQGMREGVVKNYRSMASGAQAGLQKLAQMTNRALKALGVKRVDFSIGTAEGKQRGGEVRRRQYGGPIPVPGEGSGDKVPMHIGGQLRAMLEPGEDAFILNRTASAKKRMLETWNSRVKRRARGGWVGDSPAGLNPAVKSIALWAMNRYGASASDTVAPRAGSSWHPVGAAVDLVSGNMLQMAKGLVRNFLPKLEELIYTPLGFSVSGGQKVAAYAQADHYDHVHIAALGRAVAAQARQIKRVMLKGPEGPLKDMGQASLDKVREAANRYIQRRSGLEGAEGLLHGDGDVERVFARVARKLSTSKKATLALGEAGYAESGMRDLSYGDSTSQGALQLLASTAASMNINPHDEGAIASAFLLRGFYGRGGANALAARGLPAHMVAQSVQGSANAAGTNYLAQEANARAWMARFGLKSGGLLHIPRQHFFDEVADLAHDAKATKRMQEHIRNLLDDPRRYEKRFGGYFDNGGIVPGRPGQPIPIIAHGGELIAKVARGRDNEQLSRKDLTRLIEGLKRATASGKGLTGKEAKQLAKEIAEEGGLSKTQRRKLLAFLTKIAENGRLGQGELRKLTRTMKEIQKEQRRGRVHTLDPPPTRSPHMRRRYLRGLSRRDLIELGPDPPGEGLPTPTGFGRIRGHTRILGDLIDRVTRNLQTQLTQDQRKEFRKLQRIGEKDRTDRQQRRFERLQELQREHPELSKKEKIERVRLQQQEKLTKRESERLHELNEQVKLHQRESRRESRLRERITKLEQRRAAEVELGKQLGELKSAVKEQNNLLKTVRANETSILRDLLDFYSTGIGARYVNTRRSASAGTTASY